MTVRNTKRLIGALMALLVLLEVVHVGLALWRPGSRYDYFPMLMTLFLVVMFAGTLRRLSRLEAEHGPDYVQPTSPHARTILLVVGLLALVLGAVVAYMIGRR